MRRFAPAMMLATVVTVVALAGCSAGDSTPTPTNADSPELAKFTLVTPTALGVGAPEPVADKAGLFADEGLTVDVTSAGGSAQVVQAVFAGTALIGRISGLDLLGAYENNPDIGLVSIGVSQHGSSFEVVSTPENPITSPEDLVGTTVGVVSVGGATEVALDFMLDSEGIDPSEVERVVAGNSASAYQLVKSGDLSAVIITSSTRGVLELSGEKPKYFSLYDYVPIPGNVFIAKKSSVEEYPQTLAAAMTALQNAQLLMINDVIYGDGARVAKAYEDANLPNADNYAATRTAVQLAIAGWTTPETRDFLGVNTPEEWERAVDLLTKAGKLPKDFDPESAWANVIDAVKSST